MVTMPLIFCIHDWSDQDALRRSLTWEPLALHLLLETLAAHMAKSAAVAAASQGHNVFKLCRQNILIFTFATPVSRASAWTASGEASSQTLAWGLPAKQSFQSFLSFQSFQSFQRLKIIHIFYNSRSSNALLSGQRWEALAFLGMEAAPMERSAAATNAFQGCQ